MRGAERLRPASRCSSLAAWSRRARRSRAGRTPPATREELISALDYDEARAVLDGGRRRRSRASLSSARASRSTSSTATARAAILARPEVATLEAGEQLADIARGCQRVTAALVVDRDEARGIEVRWQDEHDRALAPLLFETVAKARDGADARSRRRLAEADAHRRRARPPLALAR